MKSQKDELLKPANPLLIEVGRVPPDGGEIHADLTTESLKIEGEDAFEIDPGGRVDGRVDRGDDDSLHVVGRLEVRLRQDCGRCLEAFELPLSVAIDLFFLPDDGTELVEQDIELKERDLVVGSYRGGRLDLAEVLREQIYLSLPLKRLCRDDCQGLCPTCGVNRNKEACSCPQIPDTDPRLMGLADLLRDRKN
jgi:uncharacterized protein